MDVKYQNWSVLLSDKRGKDRMSDQQYRGIQWHPLLVGSFDMTRITCTKNSFRLLCASYTGKAHLTTVGILELAS